jgi:hypothetical protein
VGSAGHSPADFIDGANRDLTFEWGTLISACLSGPAGVFIRCFALSLYGSRYKPLGDLLEASDP